MFLLSISSEHFGRKWHVLVQTHVMPAGASVNTAHLLRVCLCLQVQCL